MKCVRSLFPALIVALGLLTSISVHAQRRMENLGRGVVAVRASATEAFVSWRLLGFDPAGIGFNLYRSANGGAPTKLNAAVLTGGTNYTDASVDLSVPNAYHVRPVIGGLELAASEAFTLAANAAIEPIVRINLNALPGAGYYTKFVWVGDLDGDGEYDYVIDRLAPFDPNNDDIGLGNQYLEAYTRAGVRLWRVDMGPNSRNTYNIEPGSSTLSMGMYDGVTVYDLNGDGKSEVILKVSNGVVFPNGTTFSNAENNRQFLAILDGLTGNMIINTAFPTEFLSDGSLGTQLGVGHLTGGNPSVVLWGRNRVGSGPFNDVFAAYSWDGGASITQDWKRVIPAGTPSIAASHQMRIIDVDGDGLDEVATGNFMVNSNGTLRYQLPGVGHGDRFHITKMDPTRPGLQGYGIQQNNDSRLWEYYYDASTGEVLWQHFGDSIADIGRGLVGDVDPAKPGYEVWSFMGLFNGPSNTLAEPNTGLRPYPTHSFWWDGDVLTEGLNDHKFEKWDPANPKPTNALPRLLTTSNYGAVIAGHNPMFFGDILGDWRTEVVLLNASHTQLMVFTTNIPSATRIYTMAHNPAHRAHMTIKGYMQPPFVDYYLGAGMSTPPQPNIVPAVPATVTVPVILSVSNDTGASSFDRITNDSTPSVSGVAPAGATIVVSRIGTSGVVDDGTTITAGSGAWTFNYSTSLADGQHYFLARVDDGQNNYSFPFSIEIDTVAPAAPAISAVVANGTGGYDIYGTAAAGLRVDVTLSGVGAVGTATASEAGTWSVAYTGPALAPNSYTFSAATLDVAGNASIPAQRIVDLTATPPTIASVTADSGVSATDRITSDRNVVLSGTATAGSEVTLFRLDTGAVGTATADGSGAWSFDYSSATLADGAYAFTAFAGSSAGAPAFTVRVDGAAPNASGIALHSPSDGSTTASEVVFRVAFNEAIAGADIGDFTLVLNGGVSGAIASVTPTADNNAVDVRIGPLAGEGTVRIDLNANGTGITDLAGNAIAGGFSPGEEFTRQLIGNGTWVRTATDGFWSTKANWAGGIVAQGADARADFSTLDLTSDNVVHVDSPRTLNEIVFGDTVPATTASWIIDGDGNPANALTLVNQAGPRITVNALGTGARAVLAASLGGNQGLSKQGAGTLVLAAANTLTGTVTVGGGILNVATDAIFNPGTINIAAAGSAFSVSGGTVAATGNVNISNGSNLIVDSGVVSVGAISASNNSGNAVRINGGIFTAGNVSFQRSTANSLDYNTGLIVKGGNATVGSIALGTANSNALASVEGGSLTATGAIVLGNQSSGGRGGHIRVTAGTFRSTDTAANGGLIVTRRGGNASSANFLGGVSTVEKITLGFDATITAGSGTLTVDGGALYLGAGGIVSNAGGAFAATITLNSGVLGAKADWSSNRAITLPAGGDVAIKAADALDEAHDVTLSGVLSGAGSLTKIGGGLLTLAGNNTFTGSVDLNAGTLHVSGSLASGGAVNLNGGQLTASGAINKPVVLNGGATLAANSGTVTLGGSALTWNDGGAIAFNLGANGVSGQLALNGAFTKGTSGAYVVAFSPGVEFAAGNTYTLATFTSTTFATCDFAATGLPTGYAAAFTVGETSLTATIVGTPFITSATSASGQYAAPFSYTITAGNAPTTFSATGLPAGLNLDVNSGLISGTPSVSGTFNITVGATNIAGTGTATLVLTLAKAPATIALSDLVHAYDGTPKAATATTTPAGLNVTLSYNGSTTAPTLPGSYEVIATIQDANYSGTTNGTLVITITTLVRHAPTLNGEVEGSVQVLLPENITLNGGALISGDLLVPGLPNVQLNGQPTYGSTIDSTGAETPSNYSITLNGGAVLRHVVRRANAIEMPTVAAPAQPAGTRNVTLNSANDTAGDFATVRNLTLNGNAGSVVVPPGAYGNVIVNGNNTVVLGVAGATAPASYDLQQLTLNGNSTVQIVGPVVVTLGSGIQLNGSFGSAANANWLTLQLASGDVTLNGQATIHGRVIAPNGRVTINGSAAVHGSVAADRLIINGQGLLQQNAP